VEAFQLQVWETWSPRPFAFNLNYTEAGFYTMIPLLGGALDNLVSGSLVDKLYRSGKQAISRRLPAVIGFSLAALGLVMSVGQAEVSGAVFWLAIAIFGADMTLSPSWSFCIDIGGRHAGKVSGTMNMAGNLGSAIVAIAFPYLIAWTGGPTTFFYIGAGMNLFAIVFWFLSNPEGRIQEAAA
jgi:ACS family glucarate transporter-like MFS transporter